MHDKEIRQHVIEELDFDPVLDRSQISAAVKDGIVTLMGEATSLAQKFAAERAATRVVGVRGIANEIVISTGPNIDDDDIALRAANILSWDAVLPKNSIQVVTQDGRLTLEGEVNWHYQRKRAEGLVSQLEGIEVVLNHIKIKPSLHAIDVSLRIKDALRRNASVEADSIHVIVDGSTVTLQGNVKAWHEKELAEHAAWSAIGVTDVIDQLRISYS